MDHLLTAAVEQYARFDEAPGWFEDARLPIIDHMLFRADAESRGYDMRLFDEMRREEQYVEVLGIYR